MTSAKLCATSHSNNFDNVDHSEHLNKDAHALSKIKWPQRVKNAVVKAIFMSYLGDPNSNI